MDGLRIILTITLKIILTVYALKLSHFGSNLNNLKDILKK